MTRVGSIFAVTGAVLAIITGWGTVALGAYMLITDDVMPLWIVGALLGVMLIAFMSVEFAVTWGRLHRLPTPPMPPQGWRE